MGSCVSTHSKSSQGSAMKHKTEASHQNPAVMSQSPDLGSKDDMFFDSQPWLESDGEEDFVSVNGDCTPTSGNTPADQNLCKGATNQVINSPVGWTDEASVKEKRKKLADLLKEGLREDQSEEQEDISSTNQKFAVDRNQQHQPRKLPGSVHPPSASVTDKPFCSSTDQRTANGDITVNKAKTSQGCFTGLVSCRSFSESKRRLSPAIGVTDDKA